jgi:A/G-specific adenine glycosylase
VKIKKRYFNYLVIKTPSDQTIALQRKSKGIWQNLYEFPLIEAASIMEKEALMQQPDFFKWSQFKLISCEKVNPKVIKHVLSHQHLYIQFWKLQLGEEMAESIDYKELKSLPVPVVIQHFIENNYVD